MTTKTCTKCQQRKEITEFFKDKNNKTDGRYSICKTCKQKSTHVWRDANRARYNEYMRKKNKEQYPVDRLRRYGLTVEQHTEMLAAQNHVCAICAKPPTGKRPLVVDHHHESGTVRGLLCYGCNRAIAILDNVSLLQKAMDYLKKATNAK